MWKVPDSLLHLPAGFAQEEDEDRLIVRCLWCGHETTYMARHLSLDEVEANAWGHLSICSTQEGRDAHRAR